MFMLDKLVTVSMATGDGWKMKIQYNREIAGEVDFLFDSQDSILICGFFILSPEKGVSREKIFKEVFGRLAENCTVCFKFTDLLREEKKWISDMKEVSLKFVA